MHKSKLIRLLKVLDKKEFKRFAKFINSPYFNSNKQFFPLYQYLSKHYPDFDSPELTKEQTFKTCFPKKKYSYNIMSNLMSSFVTLTEEYLLTIQFQKKPFTKKKTLVQAFGERKDCYDLYEKYNGDLVKEVQGRTINDMGYHQDLRELNHDYFYHPTTNRQTIGNSSLQNIMDDLDIFYAQTKLLYLLEMKSRAYILGEKYTLILDEKVMFEKEDYFEKESPICLVYLKILQLYEVIEDKKVFNQVKNLFSENIEIIGKTERTIILLHLLNYCIRVINKGDLAYIKESLGLYKIGLVHNILVEQNKMAEMTFSNIVINGAGNKEFDWTENFIIKYQSYLEENERADATIYSMAFLNFSQQKYSETIDLLINHSFEKPLTIIKSKSLLLRTYFEQFLLNDSYYELFLAQTHAFEKYIRRNSTISIEKSKAYINFIQFVRQMAIGILGNKSPSNLLHSLEAIPSISCKSWILKKIEERDSKLQKSLSNLKF